VASASKKTVLIAVATNATVVARGDLDDGIDAGGFLDPTGARSGSALAP
jgi:hypothetical protein